MKGFAVVCAILVAVALVDAASVKKRSANVPETLRAHIENIKRAAESLIPSEVRQKRDVHENAALEIAQKIKEVNEKLTMTAMRKKRAAPVVKRSAAENKLKEVIEAIKTNIAAAMAEQK